MNNPFEVIEARLSNIESLILDIKHKPSSTEEKSQSDQLLTVDQAAKFLNLTKPTIYSKVSKGELPYMKKGKRLYFSKDELLEYIKSGKKETNSTLKDKANQYLKPNK